MMSSTEIWITSVLERCLTAYGRGPADTYECEDDGNSLRFSAPAQYSALIYNWTEQAKTPTLTLTDSTTQIEAVLAPEALKEYGKTSPEHPLSRDVARGYYIQLLEFQIVLEYFTVEPKVHLYVQSFDIDWHRGKIKSAPQGKFVNKNASVKKLMQHAFRQAKGPEPREVHSERFDDTFGSQAYQGPASQDILMSQIPSIIPARSPVAHRSSISSSIITNKLLGNPGLQSATSDGRSPQQMKWTVPEFSNDKVHTLLGTKAAEQLRSRQDSDEMTKAPDPITGRRNSSATSPGTHGNSRETGKPEALVQRPSTEREVLADGAVHKASCAAEMSHHVTTESGTTSSPSQEINSDKPSFGVTKSRGNPCASNTDPWHGMTRIRRRDVQIPKEQAELLEQHRRRWIPPSPGESTPQGHVPPRLLDQWNKIALRRSHMARDQQSMDVGSEPLETHEPLPSRPSPTPQMDSDSDGEPLTSQWSSSPEKAPRSRQVLPEDSSPVRGRALRKEEPLDGKQKQPPGRASVNPTYGNQVGPHSISMDREASRGAASSRKNRLLNKDDVSQLEDKPNIYGLQDESDAESDDSVMDTSVPCPLGGDIQQSQVTSHSEQAITSSGLSLSGASVHGHVQVVDTPDTNRHRSTDLAAEVPELQARHSELSSEAAKWSSQSRIQNTYVSSGSKGNSSQDKPDTHRADGRAVPHDINMNGTQVISGSLPTNGSTERTTSDVSMDSSAPRVQPGVSNNVPEHQSQASNQSSSYREIPSSIPSETGEEAPTDMETRKMSAKHAAIPPTKRRASEMEHEQLSPAKRPKIQRNRESTEEPVLNVVVRRESYISHSAQKWEAQRVYEKFRRDYPNYLGDFDHFVMVCSKLYAVRSRGRLQRSFLWDDFIIKHLEEYSLYLEQCLSADTKSLVYEEFFSATCIKPSYKKRSLTAHGIDISAAQYVPDNQANAPSMDALPNKPSTSFTGSLIERFTNFHAHSFTGTQDTQSDADMEYMSCFMSSPTVQTKARRAINEPGSLTVMAGKPMDVDSTPEQSAGHETEPASDGQTAVQHTTVDSEQPSQFSASQSELYYELADPAADEDSPSVQLEQHLKSTVEESEFDLRKKGSSMDQSFAMIVEQPLSPDPVQSEVDHIESSPAAHDHSQAEDLDSYVQSQVEEDYTMREQPMVDLDSSIPESLTENRFLGLHDQSRDIDLGSSIPESEAGGTNPAMIEQVEALEPGQPSESMIIRDSTESDLETAFSPENKSTAPEPHHPVSFPPDSEAGFDPEDEDEDEDMNDETHETASIELGEDTQPADAQLASDTDSDAESGNENWFLSLRHIRPTSPVWSDDPNTPFKQWARADQNVLSERNRRGGAYLPVDEKGVIQRPGYRQ
ncbi:uncharacterized protein BO80DRAFT_467488 [Aspergillus ibericus CBS 121593]|uniref:Telomere replication protein EST3 n=1 Tax=Aspergillus ibericus CBS 121593 TaxID=1448316 RepID=A0A395GQM3_9EURO|nr:hypothetical protein BO80DRAFT_467488 [Aspergillus ibericus CBS 121593]RAK97841.1 hypothetical protein BO80DRAFT_467488 [Aspergillus ibericus CBS 121593]